MKEAAVCTSWCWDQPVSSAVTSSLALISLQCKSLSAAPCLRPLWSPFKIKVPRSKQRLKGCLMLFQSKSPPGWCGFSNMSAGHAALFSFSSFSFSSFNSFYLHFFFHNRSLLFRLLFSQSLHLTQSFSFSFSNFLWSLCHDITMFSFL